MKIGVSAMGVIPIRALLPCSMWLRLRCCLGTLPTRNRPKTSLRKETVMDNRKLACFLLLVSSIGVSHADGFFVNANVGEVNFYPQYRDRYSKDHSYSEALRAGYRWDAGAFSYGLEAGYVNLGHSYDLEFHNTGGSQLSERIDGALLGANLKYAWRSGFFISGRGGFFRSTDHQVSQYEYWIVGLPFGPHYKGTVRESPAGMGSYWGAGLGYDFNKSFGVSLNYDRYRPHVVTDDADILFSVTPRVDAYSIEGEYRF